MEECCVCENFEWIYLMSETSNGGHICPCCMETASVLSNLSEPVQISQTLSSSGSSKRFRVTVRQPNHNYNHNRKNYLVFIPE